MSLHDLLHLRHLGAAPHDDYACHKGQPQWRAHDELLRHRREQGGGDRSIGRSVDLQPT